MNPQPGELTFDEGERLAVWSWDGAHKCLVSVVKATPSVATIVYGPPRHRRSEEVSYNRLTTPKSGEGVTYALLAGEASA